MFEICCLLMKIKLSSKYMYCYREVCLLLVFVRILETLMSRIQMREKPKVIDLTRKIGTVETLTEARINCTLEEKVTHGTSVWGWVRGREVERM